VGWFAAQAGVETQERAGADARVWEKVSGADFAHFLQTGHLREGDTKSLKNAMAVAESVPESAYHEAIRDALRNYYVRNMYGLKRKEADRMRAILQLQEGHFFPEDKRLGVRLFSEFPEDTPLATIVRSISEASKIPLHVDDDEIGKEKLVGYKTRATLRDQLQSLAIAGSSWRRVGAGYFLAVDHRAPTPPDSSPSLFHPERTAIGRRRHESTLLPLPVARRGLG
jgi:hypothetical protein